MWIHKTYRILWNPMSSKEPANHLMSGVYIRGLVRDTKCRGRLSSCFLEKILLEALLNYIFNAGICATEAVKHCRIRLIGITFPKNVALLVKDRRSEPGAGAVEDHLLSSLDT